MSWIDWLIVVVPVVFIIGIAFCAKRYARSAADFLAAGRVAGRYVISVGDLMSWLSVIILIAGCEQTYQTGFGISFWNNILTPISLVLALTGFCTYRWRQTRCLSKGQFIELRYGSKFFRIFTAFISTFSEMITNALGPAIAANFFLYYLGLPHKIMICGINLPCYVIIVATCLVLAMLILWPAGRISLLITDSLQAVLSYPIFVMIVGFIILKLSWDVDVTPLLWDRVPQESFINPYDVAQFRDFNIFALVTQVTSSIMNRASWIGNDASNAGRTPHEQKMAGILGAWRGGLGLMMIGILALLTYVFMNSGNFAALDKNNHFKVTNNEVRQELSSRVLDEAVADPARRDAAKNALAALPDIRHEIGKDAPISQSKNLDSRYFNTVRQSLGDSPEALAEFQQYRSLYNQMLMPVVTSKLFPVGLIGFFCLLMVMLLISTDDARLFNASCCITQDMILPLFKKRITPEKTHHAHPFHHSRRRNLLPPHSHVHDADGLHQHAHDHPHGNLARRFGTDHGVRTLHALRKPRRRMGVADPRLRNLRPRTHLPEKLGENNLSVARRQRLGGIPRQLPRRRQRPLRSLDPLEHGSGEVPDQLL